jgi:dihydroflavonol-4-reductase
MKVALTGATGFVGLALVERLVAEGHSVRALCRRSSAPAAREALQSFGVQLVEGDVTAPATLPPLVDGADLVLHVAAIIGYRRRLHAPMQRVNVEGTRHVLEACRAARSGRLVHLSSIAAVGVSPAPVPLTEESRWNAAPLRAPYFDTKHASEQLVLQAAAGGLDAVVVNPAAIYGPARVPGNSSRLVRQIARGRMRVAPEGGINVVPLATVVEGVLAAARLGQRGRRYILGGENLGLRELIVRVGAAAGLALRPRQLPTWSAPFLRAAMDAFEPLVPDTPSYTPDLCGAFGWWLWYDVRRMREELGVQPADLDDCLRQTVAQLRRDGLLR